MGGQKPGPLCSTRVGDDWIDLGTMCRSQTPAPGLLDVSAATIRAALGSALKTKFDRDHVYSRAPEAARKRDIDLQIIGDDYSRSAEISLNSDKYLKQLIKLGSNGDRQVSDKTKKIQFFIIRGGAEGFLPSDMAGKDASNVLFPGSTTDGKKSPEFRFDNNDLLAVFDPRGKLIGAALLQRPTSISGIWSTKTANAIYNAWDNKEVSIYRNTNFDVPYLGLLIDDGMKKKGWVDLHKQEATNGCIFIVDPATPEYGTEELKTFEPKLLTDVLASIGKRPEDVKGRISLGVMRLVDIKP
ncbi:MAG: hypothetical protein WCA20_19480 [Candidatus Sulfotelmatobacter sp.]